MGALDRGWVVAGRDDREVPARRGELRGLVPVAEQAVVTDPTETPWQDVQDEATEQIGCLEGEDLFPAAVSVIAPAHADDAVCVESFGLDQREGHIAVESCVMGEIDALLGALTKEAADGVAACSEGGGERRGGWGR